MRKVISNCQGKLKIEKGNILDMPLRYIPYARTQVTAHKPEQKNLFLHP